jgi:hypothetical protein
VESIDVFAAILSNHNDIFDTHSAPSFAIQTRFDSNDISREQRWTSYCEQWRFMDLQSQSVAGPVWHAAKRVGSPLGGQPHQITGLLDRFDGFLVNLVA